jgi:E3 ubiquitin-protein ligase DCST1
MIVSLLKFIKFLIKKASKHDEAAYQLLHGPREKLRALKLFLSALYGSLIGLAFYRYILFPIGIPTEARLIVAGVLCLCCALMCALSSRFRCVSVLMWLEGLGKAGRTFIKALVFALVLTGPVNNLLRNTKESVRVLECTTYLTYNLTKTRVSLAVKPFMNAFAYMDANVSDIKEKFNEIKQVIEPITHEIEHQSNDEALG